MVIHFVVAEEQSMLIELSIHLFNRPSPGHSVFFTHSVFEVYVVLLVEVSKDFECPLFTLLVLDDALKHISAQVLFDPFVVELELQWRHHVFQLAPHALDVAQHHQ